MSLNPLAQVKDYHSMLNRIAWLTTVSATVAVWRLRLNWQWFNGLFAALDSLDFELSVADAKVAIKILGYLIPGVVIALCARAVRLHDRLSDLLRIRESFDVEEIIVPMARGAGFPVGTLSVEGLKEARSKLMGPIFYRYASSTDPKIDKHLIYEALDWWSWYWALVESIAILGTTALILAILGGYSETAMLAIGCVVMLVVLPFFRRHCARYAAREVDEILADDARKGAVLKEFRALSS